MTEIRPIPLIPTLIYLKEKYIYEKQRDIIISDYLYISAISNLSKEAKKDLPRYSSLILKNNKQKQAKVEEKTAEEMVDDVIKMFRGE